MKLKKLLPILAEGIINAGFDKEPKEIQTLSVPKIKSGTDIYMISPEGRGKTTALAIGVIQRLKAPFEEAPRALIMVETKEKAYEFEKILDKLIPGNELRTMIVFDKGDIQYQKDEIYEGCDVVIGMPRRINELLNISGIPLTKLQMLIADDADILFKQKAQAIYLRIADGMPKCQFIITANEWSDKFDLLDDQIMKNPVVLEVE